MPFFISVLFDVLQNKLQNWKVTGRPELVTAAMTVQYGNQKE